MSLNDRVMHVLPGAITIIGILVISQAASFARPDEGDSLAQLIFADRTQATLLFALGVGCFVQIYMFRWLTKRLDEQEQRLKRLLARHGDAEFTE